MESARPQTAQEYTRYRQSRVRALTQDLNVTPKPDESRGTLSLMRPAILLSVFVAKADRMEAKSRHAYWNQSRVRGLARPLKFLGLHDWMNCHRVTANEIDIATSRG